MLIPSYSKFLRRFYLYQLHGSLVPSIDVGGSSLDKKILAISGLGALFLSSEE